MGHDINKFVHGAGGPLKCIPLLFSQRDVEDTLDPIPAELHRDTNKEIVDSIVTLQKHTRRDNSLPIEQDRIDHVDDRGPGT